MMLPMLIGWIIGVPLTIWWPRPKSPEHPGQARAYRTIRLAAGCLIVSNAFYIAVQLSQIIHMIGLPVALGIGFGYGAFMLSPLASCATALDVQRRSMAIVGSYGACLFTGGQVWTSALSALLFGYLDPNAPVWWGIFMLVSAVSGAVALFLVLELYTQVRRPLNP